VTVADIEKPEAAIMPVTTTTLRFAVLLKVANAFLDSYTYLARGGVFANTQTGNVIFLAMRLSEGRTADAVAHLWPILAFVVGIGVAAHLKSGRLDRYLRHPLRWTMLLQAVVLAIIGFVPASVPNSFVNVPISFVAALQMGLFRTVADLAYMPVATTGNLMRLVEAGYTGMADHDPPARQASRIYAVLIAAFVTGAVIGAFATRAFGVRAIWLPAGLLTVTLALFIVDEWRGLEP
jgi:uncharacterized membrane protein YoaK (UPF0700 family)